MVEFNYRTPKDAHEINRLELEKLIPGIPSNTELTDIVKRVGKKGLLCKMVSFDIRDHKPATPFYKNYQVVLRSNIMEITHELSNRKTIVYRSKVEECKRLEQFPRNMFLKRRLR